MNETTIRLSRPQRAVVEYENGPLLIVAGPGSGKTRVLTERVRWLLSHVPGHFRVLALTFTNKAANEMAERLKDLGDLRERTFIGTLHGFCLNMLADRGKPIGVTSLPQIFEHAHDRKQVLIEAVMDDPTLIEELESAGSTKDKNRRIDGWLRLISFIKSHPITHSEFNDPLEETIFEAYNAGLRASGAYDFDDLLLLSYRLLTENPKIADFYRRLYGYVCIDEAQDLNEAQYAVIRALCGDDFKNVMMVGDPKQSIYGFNTSSPEFMQTFARDFEAKIVELTENFRSSRVVVKIARVLEPSYTVEGQLPILGESKQFVGKDEDDEARLVADEISRILKTGHPDVEGDVTPQKCAILGRTRFTLLAVESELKGRDLPFFKRLSSVHENESDVVDEFQLALRVAANPQDRLHLAALAKKWGLRSRKEPILTANLADVVAHIRALSTDADIERCGAIATALESIARTSARPELLPAIDALRKYADTLRDEERRAVYDDTEVLLREWDQYLRQGSPSSRTLGGFLSGMALGTTQQINRDGIALLTVHSAKGLEFDVVFIVGMADGVFPDYRSEGKPKEAAEERRNAFVAVTRSKRLLYFSYPATRRMPWGDVWESKPSLYLRQIAAAA